MANAYKIFLKEIRAYLSSPAMYIFVIVFLVYSGFMLFYTHNVFTEGVATMAPYFNTAPFILIIFVPAIAMRLWAEENKTGTMELLMTLPIKDWEAVFGKYLAAASVLCTTILLTAPMPFFVVTLADPDAPVDIGPLVSGYLGLLLIGLGFLSLSSIVSAMTKNQIVALIIGATVCFISFWISHPTLINYMPFRDIFGPFLSQLGFFNHALNLFRGIFDTRNIIYFLCVIFAGIYLTIRVVESRRWR